MFGGYLSHKRITAIEKVFKEKTKKPSEFIFQTPANTSWVCNDYPNIFSNTKQVIVTDGIPVIGNIIEGYRTLDMATELSGISDKFMYCLNNIVTNNNLISVSQTDNRVTVKLASSNVSCGRVFYIKKQNTIIFSDDLRLLIPFSNCTVNYNAYIAILKYAVQPDPLTIIQDINCVPASHCLTIQTQPNSEKLTPYFKLNFNPNSERLEPVEKTLKQITKYLSKTNPVIMLSGGIDSTLIGYYLSSVSPKIQGHFLAFGYNDTQQYYAEQAAEKLNIQLTTHYLQDEEVSKIIGKMAKHYIQPFCDTSTIPTFYLNESIADSLNAKATLIDGVGADACFSRINEGKTVNLSIQLFKQPKFVRSAIAKASQAITCRELNKIKKIEPLFTAIDRIDEETPNQAAITLVPYNQFFKAIPNYSEYFNSTLKASLGERDIGSFDNRSTTLDLLQLVRSFAMKTYQVFPQKTETVYPFLWKDVLNEQGKLSNKSYNGINKYPLKKLLEQAMSKEFIYRQKSGFIPPINKWLKLPHIKNLASSLILTNKSFVSNIMSQSSRERLLIKNSLASQSLKEIGILIWGIMFTELWLYHNLKCDLKTIQF